MLLGFLLSIAALKAQEVSISITNPGTSVRRLRADVLKQAQKILGVRSELAEDVVVASSQTSSWVTSAVIWQKFWAPSGGA